MTIGSRQDLSCLYAAAAVFGSPAKTVNATVIKLNTVYKKPKPTQELDELFGIVDLTSV